MSRKEGKRKIATFRTGSGGKPSFTEKCKARPNRGGESILQNMWYSELRNVKEQDY